MSEGVSPLVSVQHSIIIEHWVTSSSWSDRTIQFHSIVSLSLHSSVGSFASFDQSCGSNMLIMSVTVLSAFLLILTNERGESLTCLDLRLTETGARGVG